LKRDVTVVENHNEVAETKWVTQDELKELILTEDITPWFRLICHNFLFKWWEGIEDVTQFKDDIIHKLT
jgi:isopentenyl-diphosphate Delta-isomerase